MTAAAHLWATGYDDTARADQVRDEITRLGERHSLVLLETAVIIRYPAPSSYGSEDREISCKVRPHLRYTLSDASCNDPSTGDGRSTAWPAWRSGRRRSLRRPSAP